MSSCCGTLIYMNINREKEARIAQNNSMKNTFWPFFLHMILCFVEHLVVVSVKYASQFGKKVDFRKIISMMSFCWLGKTPIHRIQKFSLNTTCLWSNLIDPKMHPAKFAKIWIFLLCTFKNSIFCKFCWVLRMHPSLF